jgi:hypothetical protein
VSPRADFIVAVRRRFLQEFWFSQHYCWSFKSSGMPCYVLGQVVPNKLWDHSAIIFRIKQLDYLILKMMNMLDNILWHYRRSEFENISVPARDRNTAVQLRQVCIMSSDPAHEELGQKKHWIPNNAMWLQHLLKYLILEKHTHEESLPNCRPMSGLVQPARHKKRSIIRSGTKHSVQHKCKG